MGARSMARLNLSTALKLGRVSNLPTVWTNVLAAMVLAGTQLDTYRCVLLCAAGSLIYVAGMFLNDAFDADHDAEHRPERPIPKGEVSAREVGWWGSLLLGSGVIASAFHRRGWASLVAAFGTAAAVMSYNAYHRDRIAGPILMGLCRAGLYVMGAVAVGSLLRLNVLLPAALLFTYVFALTVIAQHEDGRELTTRWPTYLVYAPIIFPLTDLLHLPILARVLMGAQVLWLGKMIEPLRQKADAQTCRRSVGGLIAGIALIDACFIACMGENVLALVAVAGFGLSLLAQRRVSGT